jgi:hypothetical protein
LQRFGRQEIAFSSRCSIWAENPVWYWHRPRSMSGAPMQPRMCFFEDLWTVIPRPEMAKSGFWKTSKTSSFCWLTWGILCATQLRWLDQHVGSRSVHGEAIWHRKGDFWERSESINFLSEISTWTCFFQLCNNADFFSEIALDLPPMRRISFTCSGDRTKLLFGEQSRRNKHCFDDCKITPSECNKLLRIKLVCCREQRTRVIRYKVNDHGETVSIDDWRNQNREERWSESK